MAEPDDEIDWSKTTFEGSRREQLKRWKAMTVRQRLEAMDELCALAERIAAGVDRGSSPETAVHEPPSSRSAGDRDEE